MIATLQLLVGYLVFVRAVQRHQPAPLAQFDCNENCATMLGGGRGCGRCLHLTLRGFECGNPNLIGKATLTASWNLRNYETTPALCGDVRLTWGRTGFVYTFDVPMASLTSATV